MIKIYYEQLKSIAPCLIPVLGKINETIVWYNAFDAYVGSHIIRYLAECLRYMRYEVCAAFSAVEQFKA